MIKKSKLVYGVGCNDADYPVHVCAVIDGKRKALWTCPAYLAWTNMLKRCYSGSEQARRQTYLGCTVTPEWRSFSAFRAWMLAQDHEGNHLDKDILVTGNKSYGPGACVFVSSQLNSFLLDRCAARGEWPLGVSWDKGSGKFMARCSNPFTGKNEKLGRFTCQNAAHEAWRARKHEHACRYADQQTDPRIAQALRTRYANGAVL